MTQIKTHYAKIVNANEIASTGSRADYRKIISSAEHERLSPAADDKIKRLLLAIDIQNDFMEGIGSLAVPGSKGDVERLTKWIYSNLENLTQIVCSLDTHSTFQIFHPCWWVDENGSHPTPYTIISYNDALSGKWTPVYGEKEGTLKISLEYLKELEER